MRDKMEQTLVFIKPDGVKKRLIGECIRRFEEAGLDIAEIRSGRIPRDQAERLYSHLVEKLPDNVFKAIVEYITSGKVVFMIVEGEDAVWRVRDICGPTNPKEAPRGTIRGDFATDDLKEMFRQGRATQNIIHASGSREEARGEIELFFSEERQNESG
jgi:nucleoside-diphosphate kinase